MKQPLGFTNAAPSLLLSTSQYLLEHVETIKSLYRIEATDGRHVDDNVADAPA